MWASGRGEWMENSRTKLVPLVVVCSIMAALLPAAHGSPNQRLEAVKTWFNDLQNAKQKFTNLRFYMHDIVIAKYPTAIQVAQAETSNQYPTLFGRTVAMDDPLTLDPDPSSEIIGRAQGIYVSVSQTAELHYMLVMNFVFTAGEYNGSTLSFLCNDPVFHDSREMEVVGGTGAFRLASGVAVASTYNLDETNYNAIEEYNVFLVHY